MSDVILCPCCGRLAPADEIKRMPHAAALPGCATCRARVLAVGRHDRPFEPKAHQRAVDEHLAKERAA